MVILYGVSGIVCLLGLLLLIRAIRGRRVSSNPHCAHCGFDLLGLTLDHDAQCPECGRPTIPGTPAVRDGLFKRRPVLAMVALLLIAGGVTGFAWPKVSQIPSIKNFDWYAHFPESLLLKLEAGGNKDALAELHSRLIPGTISDEGLETLVERSLAMIEDESVVWDDRWGDVLVIAMLEEHLVGDTLYNFIESAIGAEFETRPVINDEDQFVYYRLLIKGNPRAVSDTVPLGTPKSRILQKWVKIHGEDSPFQINIEYEQTRIDKPLSIQFPSGQAWLRGWAPIAATYFNSRGRIALPPDSPDQITLHTRADFTLLIDGQEVHAWSKQLSKTIQRSAGMIVYAQAIADEGLVKQFADGLSVGYIQLPIERSLGRLHFGTRESDARTVWVHYRGDEFPEEIAMLFDASVAIDGVEIEFASLFTDSPNALDFKRDRREERNMLDYFDRHEEFWQSAIERRHVDLILRPNPKYAQYDPRFKAYLDAPVIFRDVPLMVLLPTSTGGILEQTGEPQWQWLKENQKSYPSTFAEIFIEADDE